MPGPVSDWGRQKSFAQGEAETEGMSGGPLGRDASSCSRVLSSVHARSICLHIPAIAKPTASYRASVCHAMLFRYDLSIDRRNSYVRAMIAGLSCQW